MENVDPIDDLLDQLEKDESKKVDFNNVVKLQMSFPDNFGMVMFAPFQGTVGNQKQFYTMIPGVREIKLCLPSIDNGITPSWVRIMPKEYYGDLNEEQSVLYDKVAGLYDSVAEKHTEGDAWKVVRTRTYSLFYGVLLKHVDRSQKELTDNKGKSVLFVFPAKAPVNELGKAIKSKTNALNGNRSWVSKVFDATNSNREGAVIINFERPETGAYQASVSFEFNSTFGDRIVAPSYPEENSKLFGDPVSDFLGRFNGKDGEKFNSDLFRELGKALSMQLADPKKDGNPNPEPAPENKNGNDPMIQNNKAPEAPAAQAEAPTPAPTQAPTQAPTADPAPVADPAPAGDNIPGSDKLPF